MFEKAKKWASLLGQINWLQTLSLYSRIRKPRSCSVRVLNHSIISIDKTATVLMEDRTSLEINRQDYPIHKGLKCRLQLSEHSTLHIQGHVSLLQDTTILLHPCAKLSIGDNSYLNGANIDCTQQISIGKDCAIANGVQILDNNWHKLSGGAAHQQPISIGNHVWIATNAIILPGVHIGDGCVIAAGAVVTHDVPDKCLVAGVPARVIRKDVNWTHNLLDD